MKLLIITQKVDINDDVLGFFHKWIEEFSSHFEKVIVICLNKGMYNLPENVKVYSLGKEQRISKIKYLFNFYKYIWQERKNYDSVFVHMNKEYVLLGGLLWKLLGKKVGLWYAHKAVNLKLRIAEKLADVIFTASKESFMLKSRKVIVMGHGIDINKFQITNSKFQTNSKSQILNSKFIILSVGRISRIKGYETLIKAVELLYGNEVLPRLQVDIIGGTIMPEDEKYLADLKEMVKEKKLDGIINFIGAVPHKDIIKYYNDANLSVNLSPTGGMDKVVLEAMACGVPVIAYNKTFVNILSKHQKLLILSNADEKELAEKIKKIITLNIEQKKKLCSELQKVVIINYSLTYLIKRIVDIYKSTNMANKISQEI